MVEASTLNAGQTYTFRLVVTTKNPAGTGEAEISFRVNNVREMDRGGNGAVQPLITFAHQPCCLLFAPQPPKPGSVIVNPAGELDFGTSVIISAAEFRCAAASMAHAALSMPMKPNARAVFCPCMRPLHSDDDPDDVLSYNFVVTPPTGDAYAALNAPARSLSAVLGLLPLGTSQIRAVAYDLR